MEFHILVAVFLVIKAKPTTENNILFFSPRENHMDRLNGNKTRTKNVPPIATEILADSLSFHRNVSMVDEIYTTSSSVVVFRVVSLFAHCVLGLLTLI